MRSESAEFFSASSYILSPLYLKVFACAEYRADSSEQCARTAASRQYIPADFRNFNYTEKGSFGEPITLIGFPSADQDGSVIMPTMQFAISAKSKNQEAAWQFLRYYLTEEYQEEAPGFPLSMKVLEMRAKEAMDRPYYLDDFRLHITF